jgi:hypothetical protein
LSKRMYTFTTHFYQAHRLKVVKEGKHYIRTRLLQGSAPFEPITSKAKSNSPKPAAEKCDWRANSTPLSNLSPLSNRSNQTHQFTESIKFILLDADSSTISRSGNSNEVKDLGTRYLNSAPRSMDLE